MTAVRELDDVLVDRLMAGTAVAGWHAQVPERTEAIRRLAALGLNDTQIGRRLRMTADAVQKNRTRHDIPAGVPQHGSSTEPTWNALLRGRRRAA